MLSIGDTGCCVSTIRIKFLVAQSEVLMDPTAMKESSDLSLAMPYQVSY